MFSHTTCPIIASPCGTYTIGINRSLAIAASQRVPLSIAKVSQDKLLTKAQYTTVTEMDQVSTALPERTLPHTRRYGHVAAEVDGNVYMWGGMESSLKQCSASSVVMIDTKSESWEEKITSGIPPAGVVGSAWITVGTKVYTLGGIKDIANIKSLLYQLDLLNMEWSEVRPKNPLQGPEGKTGCGVVSLGNDMLVVFGGQTLSGYTNELHIFNLNEG